MSVQRTVAGVLALVGVGLMAIAVSHERRMQRHRRPGVSYADVTLRRDGGWRREELFTAEGLAHQRRASRCGVAGAICCLAAIAAWAALDGR